MVPFHRSAIMLVFLVSLLLPSVAMGAPVACISQPDWSDYYFAYPDGCTVGDKLMTGFSWNSTVTSSVGTLIRSPDPISSSDTAGFDFTLLDSSLFGYPFSAGPTQTKSFAIAFTTTVQPGGGFITGSLYSLVGAVTAGGTIEASEATCLGGTFSRPISGSPLCSSGLTAAASSTFPQVSASAAFSPVESMDTILTITVSGGPNGTAGLTGFRMWAAEVPEPSILVLLGSGVAALVPVVRRRKSKLTGNP